ncbi:TPA: hypothetical protein ACN376_004011 [Vibrio parahaemolyticus]|nr:hypothetical protein LN249_24070 [Vibrio alginolyticus]
MFLKTLLFVVGWIFLIAAFFFEPRFVFYLVSLLLLAFSTRLDRKERFTDKKETVRVARMFQDLVRRERVMIWFGVISVLMSSIASLASAISDLFPYPLIKAASVLVSFTATAFLILCCAVLLQGVSKGKKLNEKKLKRRNVNEK